jgi:hypothetical protein
MLLLAVVVVDVDDFVVVDDSIPLYSIDCTEKE